MKKVVPGLGGQLLENICGKRVWTGKGPLMYGGILGGGGTGEGRPPKGGRHEKPMLRVWGGLGLTAVNWGQSSEVSVLCISLKNGRGVGEERIGKYAPWNNLFHFRNSKSQGPSEKEGKPRMWPL